MEKQRLIKFRGACKCQIDTRRKIFIAANKTDTALYVLKLLLKVRYTHAHPPDACWPSVCTLFNGETPPLDPTALNTACALITLPATEIASFPRLGGILRKYERKKQESFCVKCLFVEFAKRSKIIKRERTTCYSALQVTFGTI